MCKRILSHLVCLNYPDQPDNTVVEQSISFLPNADPKGSSSTVQEL